MDSSRLPLSALITITPETVDYNLPLYNQYINAIIELHASTPEGLIASIKDLLEFDTDDDKTILIIKQMIQTLRVRGHIHHKFALQSIAKEIEAKSEAITNAFDEIILLGSESSEILIGILSKYDLNFSQACDLAKMFDKAGYYTQAYVVNRWATSLEELKTITPQLPEVPETFRHMLQCSTSDAPPVLKPKSPIIPLDLFQDSKTPGNPD